MNKKSILQQLEERAKDRPGKTVKWAISGREETNKDDYVFVQPVTMGEYDIAYAAAKRYVTSNLQIDLAKDLSANDSMMLDQALSIELLATAFREHIDHNKRLFTSHQLRQFLQPDEIAMLEKQYNLATVECSPIQIIADDNDADEIISKINEAGSTALLEVYQFRDVLSLVQRLMEKLKEYEKEKDDKKALT